MGCDDEDLALAVGGLVFQSTHPRGVRRGHGSGLPPGGDVSIHAPAWGATGAPPGARTRSAGFNPRTRVGCDGNLCGLRRGLAHVSIHAPAWGATRSIRSPSRSRSSFNPRTRVGCDYPAQLRYAKATISFNPRTRVGCDRNPASSRASPSSFNPRTRVGCDRPCDLGMDGCAGVSIHAPAWGATSEMRRFALFTPVSIHAPAWGATDTGALSRRTGRGFNPRTRVGCDYQSYRFPSDPSEFQSTHPRGVRQYPIRYPQVVVCFNPRTRVGCDGAGLRPAFRRLLVSIHAPAWGATRCRRAKAVFSICFNPRTRVGCDARRGGRNSRPGSFNPRTRVGCDPRGLPSCS